MEQNVGFQALSDACSPKCSPERGPLMGQTWSGPSHVPSQSHWDKQLWYDLDSPKTFKNSGSPGLLALL